jgi:integrase
MSIRKRSWTDARGEQRQAWLVDYRDSAGKRRAKQFARKKDAETWSTQAAWHVTQGTHTPDSATVSVEGAADIWIKRAEAEGLERATVQAYRGLAKHHVVPALGSVKLSRLTRPMVEQFRDDLVASRSRAMAAKGVRALSSIIAEAMRRGMVGQNVAADVRVSRPSRDKARVEIPTKEEIRALLDAASTDFQPMLMTAVFSGLRASELRGLRWSDIDLKGATISVNQRVDQWGIAGPPKSAAGRRTVPIPSKLVQVLKEWKLRCPRGDLGLAFPDSKGGVQVHKNVLTRRYYPAQKDAGLAKRYSFHALRHFAASSFIAQRVDLKRLSGWLGHSTVTLTLDRYGHLMKDHQQDAAIMAAAEAHLFG